MTQRVLVPDKSRSDPRPVLGRYRLPALGRRNLRLGLRRMAASQAPGALLLPRFGRHQVTDLRSAHQLDRLRSVPTATHLGAGIGRYAATARCAAHSGPNLRPVLPSSVRRCRFGDRVRGSLSASVRSRHPLSSLLGRDQARRALAAGSLIRQSVSLGSEGGDRARLHLGAEAVWHDAQRSHDWRGRQRPNPVRAMVPDTTSTAAYVAVEPSRQGRDRLPDVPDLAGHWVAEGVDRRHSAPIMAAPNPTEGPE